MDYQVGDIVKIKSFEEINYIQELQGGNDRARLFFNKMMKEYCGETYEVTMVKKVLGRYILKLDKPLFNWEWDKAWLEEPKIDNREVEV